MLPETRKMRREKTGNKEAHNNLPRILLFRFLPFSLLWTHISYVLIGITFFSLLYSFTLVIIIFYTYNFYLHKRKCIIWWLDLRAVASLQSACYSSCLLPEVIAWECQDV